METTTNVADYLSERGLKPSITETGGIWQGRGEGFKFIVELSRNSSGRMWTGTIDAWDAHTSSPAFTARFASENIDQVNTLMIAAIKPFIEKD